VIRRVTWTQVASVAQSLPTHLQVSSIQCSYRPTVYN